MMMIVRKEARKKKKKRKKRVRLCEVILQQIKWNQCYLQCNESVTMTCDMDNGINQLHKFLYINRNHCYKG